MNVLLTGSGGFIGSHIKRHLVDKFEIFCPRHKELDLTDSFAVDSFFDSYDIDFIIHSASCGVRITPDATLQEVAVPNVTMFRNLAKHASPSCRMITIGSGAEYDKSRPLNRVRESDFGQRIPQDPYGYSKYLISKEIEKRDNILNLRVFGVYGRGEDKSRVTTCIILDKLRSQSIFLRQNVLFQFINIDDLCRIISHFMQNFPTERFINAVPNDSISIKDLAEIVNDISGTHSDIIFQKDGWQNEYTADNSILKSKLPTFSFLSYEQGMRQLYHDLSVTSQ